MSFEKNQVLRFNLYMKEEELDSLYTVKLVSLVYDVEPVCCVLSRLVAQLFGVLAAKLNRASLYIDVVDDIHPLCNRDIASTCILAHEL